MSTRKSGRRLMVTVHAYIASMCCEAVVAVATPPQLWQPTWAAVMAVAA